MNRLKNIPDDIKTEGLKSPLWFAVSVWIAFLLELGLFLWGVLTHQAGVHHFWPTFSILLFLLLWLQSQKTLGLVGSLLLGALCLNGLIDLIFAYDNLSFEDSFSIAAFGVPVAQVLLIVSAFFAWQRINVKGRAVVFGFLSLFLIRAILLVPFYDKWTGELSGYSYELLEATGIDVGPVWLQAEGEEEPSTVIVDEGEVESLKSHSCKRWESPTEFYFSEKVNLTLGAGEGDVAQEAIQFGECGFFNKVALVREETLAIKNLNGSAVQLRMSVWNMNSQSFAERGSQVLLFPNSDVEVSDIQLSDDEILVVYRVDNPRGNLILLTSNKSLEGVALVEFEPLDVQYKSRK